ncbi:hypothetical protein B0T18DRAFT_31515 [Schizothecium vesticola]|uniref:Uncharacterized protein n=1 Tax=Schizothecium vesticola TaxID=314040 RepID=A0AA40FAE2_9PEZI|nr:hypothetical protein B0T18DRAFT_31515 [Schizothecium vesticola]
MLQAKSHTTAQRQTLYFELGTPKALFHKQSNHFKQNPPAFPCHKNPMMMIVPEHSKRTTCKGSKNKTQLHPMRPSPFILKTKTFNDSPPPILLNHMPTSHTPFTLSSNDHTRSLTMQIDTHQNPITHSPPPPSPQSSSSNPGLGLYTKKPAPETAPFPASPASVPAACTAPAAVPESRATEVAHSAAPTAAAAAAAAEEAGDAVHSGASKPRIALGRTSHVALLGGVLGLMLGLMLRLLRVRGLRGALGLLALIALSLVDGLRYRLAAVSRLHLRPLLFSGVDGSNQPPRGRRGVFGGIQCNQR